MGWFSKADEGFFLTTVVPNGEGAKVAQFLGVVNGEAIIGANIFRDLFSSVRDVVGGRAGGYERALSGARDAAIKDMITSAKEMGADGIVGIDFDYEVLGEANGMMMVAVSGTAVKMGECFVGDQDGGALYSVRVLRTLRVLPLLPHCTQHPTVLIRHGGVHSIKHPTSRAGGDG